MGMVSGSETSIYRKRRRVNSGAVKNLFCSLYYRYLITIIISLQSLSVHSHLQAYIIKKRTTKLEGSGGKSLTIDLSLLIYLILKKKIFV